MPHFRQPFGQTFYEIVGDGPPLLMFHGLGYSNWSWYWQRDLGNFCQIQIENRGLGGSDLGASPFELADLADDAERLLAHLDIPQVCVWGNSMGGMIAQEFALRHPHRCRGLILGCTFCGGPESVMMEAETLATMDEIASLGWNEEALRKALPLNFSQPFEEEEAFLRFRLERPPDLQAWSWQKQSVFRFDTSSRLSEYGGPALLLHGGQDRVVPTANLPILAQKLPQARVQLYPHCRHLFWLEERRSVNPLIAEFVQQCWSL